MDNPSPWIWITFSVFGFIAFVRQQKLIKTLREKGLLAEDYKVD
jgi:hypothetical protein